MAKFGPCCYEPPVEIISIKRRAGRTNPVTHKAAPIHSAFAPLFRWANFLDASYTPTQGVRKQVPVKFSSSVGVGPYTAAQNSQPDVI